MLIHPVKDYLVSGLASEELFRLDLRQEELH